MWLLHIRTLLHWRSGDSWALRFMNCRFWIHSLFRNDPLKLWITCRLWKLGSIWMMSREVVADQMKMMPSRSRDTEGLFHQTIRFVSVPVRSISVHVLIVIATLSTVRCLSCHSPCWWWYELTTSPLSFHLPIC